MEKIEIKEEDWVEGGSPEFVEIKEWRENHRSALRRLLKEEGLTPQAVEDLFTLLSSFGLVEEEKNRGDEDIVITA